MQTIPLIIVHISTKINSIYLTVHSKIETYNPTLHLFHKGKIILSNQTKNIFHTNLIAQKFKKIMFYTNTQNNKSETQELPSNQVIFAVSTLMTLKGLNQTLWLVKLLRTGKEQQSWWKSRRNQVKSNTNQWQEHKIIWYNLVRSNRNLLMNLTHKISLSSTSRLRQ